MGGKKTHGNMPRFRIRPQAEIIHLFQDIRAANPDVWTQIRIRIYKGTRQRKLANPSTSGTGAGNPVENETIPLPAARRRLQYHTQEDNHWRQDGTWKDLSGNRLRACLECFPLLSYLPLLFKNKLAKGMAHVDRQKGLHTE